MARRLSWFLPENPDVLGMLRKQAEITERGMEALNAWAAGDEEAAQRVRDAEHEADTQKRALRTALKSAFITPIGAEDIFVMSGRLDAVLNGAKDAVRESEVMAMAPDATVAAMSAHLAEAVRHLAEAFDRIGSSAPDGDGQAATDAADRAVKAQRQMERTYRVGMSALLEVDDLREVMGRRELYRRFSRIGDDVVEVAERVWYAAVKEA
jgi:uncharacterized protein Yka (UPF0111/DUF47 family)